MTQAGTRDEANQGLSIRFERSLSLETPAATPCRQVPERLGEPVTADDVAYVRTRERSLVLIRRRELLRRYLFSLLSYANLAP